MADPTTQLSHTVDGDRPAENSHALGVDLLQERLDAARIASRQGDYRTGIELAGQAAELAERLGDQKRRAAAVALTASQRQILGEYEAAVEGYEVAVQLLYAIGDDYGTAGALTSQAMPFAELGLHDEALRVLTASREIAERIGDRQLLYETYNQVGVVHTTMGDFVQADVLLRDALNLADRASAKDKFCLLNNIGFNAIGLVPFLRENGDEEGAREALSFALRHNWHALEIARSADHPYREAICVDNYGMLLGLAGDFAGATEAVERARRIAVTHDYRTLELSAMLNAGRLQALQGNLTGAAATLELLLDQPETASDFLLLVDAHREVSQVHERLGDFEKALRHHQQFHRIEREANTQRAAVRARLLVNHFELDNAKLEAENARLVAELHRIRSQELEADKQLLEVRADELDRHAHEDTLTGIWNRRYIEKQLPLLHQNARARNGQMCVSIIDVDHFKRVNDTFGHGVGDDVLRALATALCEVVGDAGFLARFGGEEFLAVFPDMSLEQARLMCEEMRITVADHPWKSIKSQLNVTVSQGLAANGDTKDFTEMLTCADERLYQAKHNGRNRVEP